MYCTQYASPLGLMTLASDGKAIVGLWFEGQKHFAAGVREEMIPRDDLPVFAQARDWLERYFDGQRPAISELPLAPCGSAFQQSVWQVLCRIPYGQTMTYGEIARYIRCQSAQAVGGAVGRNPISVIIPCHRVLGANGSLTGYAGGVDKKNRLLQLEGADFQG